MMGYALRVSLASFFTVAATASFLGLCILDKDYEVAHESISHQSFATLLLFSGYVYVVPAYCWTFFNYGCSLLCNTKTVGIPTIDVISSIVKP
ncbi:uncharacterized protein LOC111308870 isoform X1 [Durio zibethinus]|uniref:Uncharacterized protein LOC111308870 isoform X1 n=1 Tax=Durio zibethinus TaxID=66656 RepID=A0A6P6AEI9_DURZI|nr:uncharacterized protein LOC111308870 isoform X1 [Durio zibethinus]